MFQDIICWIEGSSVFFPENLYSEEEISNKIILKYDSLICYIQSSQHISLKTLTAHAKHVLSLYSKHNSDFIKCYDLDCICLLQDTQKNRLWVIRDFSGSQALYYSFVRNQLLFSSNLGKLISLQSEPKFSNFGLLSYLNRKYSGGKETLYANINGLPLGDYILFELNQKISSFHEIKTNDYLKFNNGKSIISEEEAVEIFGNSLEATLEKTANKQNGLLLSGGSDSATIAAALSSLNKLDLAVHFHYPGYADHEIDWVKELQRKYKFNLEIISYDFSSDDSWEELQEAFQLSPNGFVPSLLGFYRAAKAFSNSLSIGSTIYDGELNILDLGYSEISDPTHKLRRFFYGKNFYSIVASFPQPISSIFLKLNYYLPFQNSKFYQKYIDNLLTLLGSLGNPDYYYTGIKLGNRGLPGISRKTMLANFNYCISGRSEEYLSYFMNEIIYKYLKNATSISIKSDIIKMNLKFYGEAANMRYMPDIMSKFNMGASHPFSDRSQWASILSLPDKYVKYKRLQRLLSDNVYSMPSSIAYAPKNHGVEVIDINKEFVSGYFRNIIKSELQNKNFLNYVDHSFINTNKIEKEIDEYLSGKGTNDNIILYLYLSWVSRILFKNVSRNKK